MKNTFWNICSFFVLKVWWDFNFFLSLLNIIIIIFIYLFLFVVDFVIHWNETAMGLHVFPILIPLPPPSPPAPSRFSQRTRSQRLSHASNLGLVPPAIGASLVVLKVKSLPAVLEIWAQSLGQEDPLEKGMATHSSIFAWKIPWTEKPGGLQSMTCQRVGLDWVTNTFTFHFLPLSQDSYIYCEKESFW